MFTFAEESLESCTWRRSLAPSPQEEQPSLLIPRPHGLLELHHVRKEDSGWGSGSGCPVTTGIRLSAGVVLPFHTQIKLAQTQNP